MPETTPSFTLEVGKEYLTGLLNCRIDIQQGETFLQKFLNDDRVIVDTESGYLTVTLTQEETHNLNEKIKMEVQVHGLMDDGTAWKTQAATFKVGRTLCHDILFPPEGD